MKTFTQHIADINEKLLINKNYKGVEFDDIEYDNETLAWFILNTLNIGTDNYGYNSDNKFKRMNKLSKDEYDELFHKLNELLKKNNVSSKNRVHCRNITFFGHKRCIGWTDDDVKEYYNEGDFDTFHYDVKVLFDSEHFRIWETSENNMLYIIYYRPLNDIMLVCKIYIR